VCPHALLSCRVVSCRTHTDTHPRACNTHTHTCTTACNSTPAGRARLSTPR
jgi:hypothetical protein